MQAERESTAATVGCGGVWVSVEIDWVRPGISVAEEKLGEVASLAVRERRDRGG